MASRGACRSIRGSRRRQAKALCFANADCDRLNRRCIKLITSDRLCGLLGAMTSMDALPDDAESLKRLLLAREAELAVATAEAATLRAMAADDQALIAHLKLQIEKLRRGPVRGRPGPPARPVPPPA